MDKLPFMPWYPADYKGDTSHLTDTEDLIYRRLLDELWIARGVLPFDDVRLARRVRLTPVKFRKAWATIGAFFRIEGGEISHKRISAEIEKSQKIVEKRSKAGTKAAQKRWGKSNKNKSSDVANALPNACHPEPQGSGKPLNRVYHEPLGEQKNSDSNAEPHPTARESGGGVVSCSGEWKPLRERLGENAYQLWLDLRRELLRGGQFSTREVDQIKPRLEGYADGSFIIDTEPLEGKRWQAVQEIASAEGLSFSLRPRPALKAIDGGKA